MLQFAVRLVAISIALAQCFAALPTNFYLDIDGSSIGIGLSQICVLEAQLGADIGGKPVCWGGYGEEELENFAFVKKQTLVQIVSGQSFSCGLSIEQTVHCWAHFLARPLVDIRGLYTQISAGSNFFCGVMTDGRISCNGHSKGATQYPKDHTEKFVQVSCSMDYCCSLDVNGHVQCWGGPTDTHVITPPKLHTVVGPDGTTVEEVKSQYKKKTYAKSAEDEEGDVLETKQVSEVKFKQISVGFEFACGISYTTSKLHCWGEGKRLKKLLNGAVEGPFKQVSVGKLGACAIRADDDSLQCYGSTLHSRMALNPPSEDLKFDQIKVGPLAACAVDFDSQLHCWGGQAKAKYDIIVA